MRHYLRPFVRRLLGRPGLDADLQIEAATHQAHRADDLVRQGLSYAEAARRARLEFGSLHHYRAQVRSDHPFWSIGIWSEQTLKDARMACRRLRATPVFTLFAATSLAIGVGATTAVYSAVDSLQHLASLRVRDPDTLVFLSTGASRNFRQWTLSHLDFAELQRAPASMAGLAGSVVLSRTVSDATVAKVAIGEAVTGAYFPTLGGSTVIGRAIQPADDRADGPAVIVLGERFWRQTLGGDPAVVGRVLRVSGHPFEVIGVASASFEGLTGRPATPSEFWIPLAVDDTAGSGPPPSSLGNQDRNRREIIAIGRLTASTSIASVSTALATVGSGLDRATPLPTPDGARVPPTRGWSATSAAVVARGGEPEIVTSVVKGLVALVLLIASANIANLMLSRGATRENEFAVRCALGASRSRLIRELLIEYAMIAALSAVGAYVVARILFVVLAVDLPVARWLIVRLDPQMNLAALAVSATALVTSLLVFGVGPAWQLTRSAGTAARARSASTAVWGSRRRSIAWQVAISTGLILIAGFFVRVTINGRGHPSGLDIDRLAVGVVDFKTDGWTEARARPVIDAIVKTAAGQPGIEAASLSSGLPLGLDFTPRASVATPERPFVDSRSGIEAWLITATSDIFRTIGVPIVHGRAFDARDVAGTTPVAVVSEVTARQIFGETDPIGRQVLLRNRINMMDRTTVSQLTIIGVAQDTDTDVVHPNRSNGTVYLPLAQHYEPTLAFVTRTAGDPADLVEPMRRVVQMAAPDVAMLPRAGTASVMLFPQYELLRMATGLTGSLAGLAILLSMIGLYGVLSQVVTSRTREMGIRKALGALPRQVRRLIIRDGLRPVMQGTVGGLAFGTVCRFLLRALYPDVAIFDLVGFVIAAGLLTAAALVACHIPARRASRVEANVALKDL
ncbi:MAG: ABC transporter permease [Vicinamibacterales bacterium]